MKRILLLFCFCIVVLSAQAQMVVNNTGPNNNNPYWLASNVLVDSNFVIFPALDPNTFQPIVLPNTPIIGTFTATGFPISSGIVMCTNSVQDVLAGQSGAAANTGPHVDPDLTAVLQQINSSSLIINDRAEIIFSFVATSDSISFNYVFGSHEYPQYTCSQFNDVFGFFLTGFGINNSTSVTTVNLATIPGTTVPVAINTINQGFAGGSGTAATCLAANPNFVAHSMYYIASNNSIVSLGGYSQKFTAEAKVICGNIYTIRMAVANVSDHALGSAVFLEANSFRSPTIEINSTVNSANSFQDSLLVEGCSPSYMKFKKQGNTNVAMTINVAVTGTAVAGVDYVPFPSSITIPAGATEDSLQIQIINDGITEPNESIIVTMQPVTTNCYVYPPQQNTLWIRDKMPLSSITTISAGSNDSIYCPGDVVNLLASFSGGDGILTGWWQDDPTLSVARAVSPSITTTYYFSATDECNSDTITDSVTIYLVDYEPMTYDFNEELVCRGDTAFFEVNVASGRPPYIITWPNAVLGNTYWEIPQQDTTFYLFTIEDQCGVILTDSAKVIIAPDPVAGFSYLNDYLVPLRVQFSNRSVNAATYLWDFGDGQTSTDVDPEIDYLKPGTYLVTLTITTADGCVDITTLEVTVETDFYLYVASAFTPDGDGLNECFEMKGVGFEEIEVQIFDRWGNRVFYGNSIEECWDGTYRGEPSPMGAYTYVIFLRLPFDKIAERRGVLTLYR